MTDSKKTNVTKTEVNDYGVTVITNTITTLFENMDDLEKQTKAAYPLYLKHAHPRDGGVEVDDSGTTSITFSWTRTASEVDVYKFVRVYRLTTFDELFSFPVHMVN